MVPIRWTALGCRHNDRVSDPIVTSEGTASTGKARGRILVGAAIAGLVAVVIAVLLLTGALGGEAGEGADPDEISVQELRDFAASRPAPVYWAGAIPGRRLELTETDGKNVFVRYLTGEAVVGDGRPAFTTVGSYPVDAAYREVQQRSKAKDMVRRPAAGGGLAIWSVRRPNSVYVAYPGSDVLVEVYDPDAQRARALAL